MTFMSHRTWLVGLSIALLCLAGCEQDSTTVTGKVTYNGQPVEEGAITFRPADGKGQAFGASITNGAYTAENGSPGSRTAVIMGVKKINFGMSTEEATRKADAAQAAGKAWAGHLSEAADYIPEDAQGNSKVVEIEPREQTIDFEITGPPRQ
jgi:hypothetical protein